MATPQPKHSRSPATSWGSKLYPAFGVGLAVVVVFASTKQTKDEIASAVMLALSATAIGLLLGFLFGIPRTVQDTSTPEQGASDRKKNSRSLDYRVNTNLEQISDWLTKILIGIGLVEIGGIKEALKVVSAYFGENSDTSIQAFVIATVIYFLIYGFLVGWLWTRIFLSREFFEADSAARDSPEFYEGLMHAYLYQPPPSGFSNSIDVFQEYADRFGDPPNERIWIYVACAHAQKFLWESRGHPPDQDQLNRAQAETLRAIDNALQLESASRGSLRGLWTPDAPEHESDLRVFYNDKEFIMRLGDPGDHHPDTPPPLAE